MSEVIKSFNLLWEINIKVTNSIIQNMIKRSTMIRGEFSVSNYNVDLLRGEPLNLFSKEGSGSVRLYFEDIEWAIKKWCNHFFSVSKYLHGHVLFLDEFETKDINFILDDAIVHSLEMEGRF